MGLEAEKDYLHPFSADSRLMDLLDNPEASAVIRDYVPALFNTCQGNKNKLRIMKPIRVANIMPMDRDAIRNTDSIIRQITI